MVDRDDNLGNLHASKVLNRARDADGEVEIGRDDLAGLAQLRELHGKRRNLVVGAIKNPAKGFLAGFVKANANGSSLVRGRHNG